MLKIHFELFWVILGKKNLGKKLGGTPIPSHFFTNFSNFTNVWLFGGIFFFCKSHPKVVKFLLKKYIVFFVTLLGGLGESDAMQQIQISSHSESLKKMGVPQYLAVFTLILAIPKNFTSVLTFQEGKIFFGKSAPILV